MTQKMTKGVTSEPLFTNKAYFATPAVSHKAGSKSPQSPSGLAHGTSRDSYVVTGQNGEVPRRRRVQDPAEELLA